MRLRIRDKTMWFVTFCAGILLLVLVDSMGECNRGAISLFSVLKIIKDLLKIMFGLAAIGFVLWITFVLLFVTWQHYYMKENPPEYKSNYKLQSYVIEQNVKENTI